MANIVFLKYSVSQSEADSISNNFASVWTMKLILELFEVTTDA